MEEILLWQAVTRGEQRLATVLLWFHNMVSTLDKSKWCLIYLLRLSVANEKTHLTFIVSRWVCESPNNEEGKLISTKFTD